ncbi:hypothetical protein T439DRAFT_350833 [Meredithblackwellia eburnea MCA 4105]
MARCTPCKVVTLAIFTPIVSFITLLLLFAFLPTPRPANIELDALERLRNGFEVVRAFPTPSTITSWDRTHYALAFSFNSSSHTLNFPYSNASVPIGSSSTKIPELFVSVHTADVYEDSWFGHADEVLVWAATRPFVEEHFVEELLVTIKSSMDVEEVDGATRRSRLVTVHSEPDDRDLFVIEFPVSDSSTPSAVYFPSLHYSDNIRLAIEPPTASNGTPVLPSVLAPSYTIGFRLWEIATFGTLTLAIGRAIDDYIFVIQYIIGWAFKLFTNVLVFAMILRLIGKKRVEQMVRWLASKSEKGRERLRQETQTQTIPAGSTVSTGETVIVFEAPLDEKALAGEKVEKGADLV